MKKKICIITPTFLPKTGGSQIGIFNISKKLAEFKKDFEVHLFVPYSNYIKLNRDRLKCHVTYNECISSLKTLAIILFNFSLIISSYLPHLSEYLYSQIKNDLNYNVESVHLLSYSDIIFNNIEFSIEFQKINYIIKIIELVRYIRYKNNLTNKYPIKDIIICSVNDIYNSLIGDYISYILKDCNVLNIKYDYIEKYSKRKYNINKSIIGQEYKQQSKDIYNYLNNLSETELNYKIMNNKLDYNLKKKHFNEIREIKNIDNYSEILSDDNKLLIYINNLQDDTTLKLYISNIMASNVQQMRKEQGLKPCDKIKINFISENKLIKDSFDENKDNIFNTIRNPIFFNSQFDNKKLIDRNFKILENNLDIQIYNN